MFDLIITVMSSCGLDYVFVADHGLSWADCQSMLIDWAVDQHVTATCE